MGTGIFGVIISTTVFFLVHKKKKKMELHILPHKYFVLIMYIIVLHVAVASESVILGTAIFVRTQISF